MPTLVLLPVLDGTGRLFAAFLAALGPAVDAVVVSYPRDEPLDYAQLEAFVRPRLPSDRPFVLVGESFSGPIAVSIAASAPSGLRGLVLCCSFVKNPWPVLRVLAPFSGVLPVRALPTALLRRVLLGRFASETTSRNLEQALAEVSPRVLRGRIRSVLGIDVAALLSGVQVPLLYLRATEDRVVPRQASRLISQRMPGARLAEIEAPHLLLQAAPVEAARQVGGFMNEV